MYDPIFAKSFSKFERKRFGFCAFSISLIVALSIYSTFKPCLHPLSILGDAVNLQLSIDAIEDKLGFNNTAIEKTEVEPIYCILKPMADCCKIEGDVRIRANSSTVFFVTSGINVSAGNNSWRVQPYARKVNLGAMKRVKNWTVTLANNKDDIPMCTKNHSFPAILFSVGGYSGNHFHDFSDLVIPIYSTSLRFKRDVHFLTTDTKPWWVSKFRGLLNKLSRHEIVDIDEGKEVHCYTKVVVGLKFYKELKINPSKSRNNELSMYNFRQFLRQTYSLERGKAIKLKKGEKKKPRLMIISRKKTRLVTNVAEITRLARKLGFEVIVDEANHSTNLSKFAQIVNSCDVLMGVHGAGLTNMVFLPDNAVLIQIIPFGGIDKFARTDFGEPSDGMNLKYLEYKIKITESSLSKRYPLDHPVIKDAISLRIKGWDALNKIYLDQQNVTIDLHRFKGTLATAMEILHH
ncbi:protein O-linked-mannose beta-1,4-N-acetylglucosaminyltransferase 2-like [Olea europaea var. sylvestris]|uniref:O-linked-mannose beta-1,4-N-acetylglucosaminyltransferase 2-like n=1 Tax=Olea europaea subsp. europaea TaxID=158383 RepID=A0A8S0V8Z1_OLEEU|nr:protein O-linked-mannose beta-1,4-N-acetylglucosaminyltransferase 2-like [Olea europaea var. sylvestris]CAA3026884.1 O-linked-mannose beta-1,4-N-acetylglucosaminyltransferase 2-like [Olea europaea subsp. europaea]